MVLKELFKLVPFLLSVCIYFVLVPQSSCPIWLKAFLKCSPILFLCMYILTLGKHVSTHSKAPKLLAGLLLSAAGDIFRTLSAHQYHVHGDSLFGLAHVCYIWMFGLKPFNLLAAFFLVIIGTMYLLFLSRCLWDENLQPLQWAACIHISLISTVAWRASAETLFHQHWSWVKLFATIGGMLLLVSDFTYAVSAFCFPVYNSEMIVATYYVAQMLITVSAVNSGNTVVKNRK
ncbi:lysoplasmalogenase TMEM86A-like [Mobula hypostoma]|uniref:lysoplasmalogenase TMEM86A-like n=1 Tax=Mobula hypostoma TaxID=723540 RepID=UPI002FC38838